MRTYRLSCAVSAALLIFTSSVFGRAPVTTNDTYAASNSGTLSISAPGVLGNDFDSNGHTMTVAPITSQTFTFNGITFEQAFTPNGYQSLIPGTYSNAVVTLEPTTAASNASGFPASTTGFLGLLSIGYQFRDETTAPGTKALNLPAGNQGNNNRSGFELSWASGLMLTNFAGDDFVVFEAGSAGVAEAFMVQVHNAVDEVWSSWIYITPQSAATYNGSDVLHSTKFNLDSFGIPSNGRVDRIRVVNITNEDRMQSGGEGVVLADDNGVTSALMPQAPAGQDTYALTELDPDIVYVGVLHTLSATIPAYTATSALGATVVVNSDGSFTYDPSTSSTLQGLASGASMDDTFTYLVTDSSSGHSQGMVTVTVSGPVAGPMLSITKSGNNVVIRWANTPGFFLQATASLSEPDWDAVGITPEADGGDLTVTIDASTGMSFFRLVDPPEG